MSDFTKEYFFIRRDEKNKRLPILKADKDTGERRYYYQPVPIGSAPFIFFNGFKEEFKRSGIHDQVADVLFAGAQFIVRDSIREKLLALEIPGLRIHPAVYIDDSNNRHEDFWFVGFQDEFDCWDRQRSVYDPDPLEIGDEKMYSVYTYVFDDNLLARTPLQQKLLFKMGSTDDKWIVCHQSIAGLFRQSGQSGVALIPVGEY